MSYMKIVPQISLPAWYLSAKPYVDRTPHRSQLGYAPGLYQWNRVFAPPSQYKTGVWCCSGPSSAWPSQEAPSEEYSMALFLWVHFYVR